MTVREVGGESRERAPQQARNQDDGEETTDPVEVPHEAILTLPEGTPGVAY
jgi:hypothetical protein